MSTLHDSPHNCSKCARNAFLVWFKSKYFGLELVAGAELPDEKSLRKCGVQTGDKLKLVLAMRGGPINMRRVALPNSSTSSSSKAFQVGEQELGTILC